MTVTIKPPYFGTLVTIRLQRRMSALHVMPRANPTGPASRLLHFHWVRLIVHRREFEIHLADWVNVKLP